MSIQAYVIPGEPIKNFTFQRLRNLQTDEENLLNVINSFYGINFLKLPELNTEVNSEEIISPIVLAHMATNNEQQNIIKSTVVIFDTYEEELTKEDICIHQNFTIGIDGRHQLSYYISYKRSNKLPGEYKANLLTFDNIPFNCFTNVTEDEIIPLNVDIIDDVMAFSINTNPKASRGTVTTVKPPVS